MARGRVAVAVPQPFPSSIVSSRRTAPPTCRADATAAGEVPVRSDRSRAHCRRRCRDGAWARPRQAVCTAPDSFPTCAARPAVMLDSKVVDSRQSDDGGAIRRRRRVPGLWPPLHHLRAARSRRASTVIKRSGDREPFDRAKVVAGVQAAVKARPVGAGEAEALAAAVEDEMRAAAHRRGHERAGRPGGPRGPPRARRHRRRALRLGLQGLRRPVRLRARAHPARPSARRPRPSERQLRRGLRPARSAGTGTLVGEHPVEGQAPARPRGRGPWTIRGPGRPPGRGPRSGTARRPGRGPSAGRWCGGRPRTARRGRRRAERSARGRAASRRGRRRRCDVGHGLEGAAPARVGRRRGEHDGPGLRDRPPGTGAGRGRCAATPSPRRCGAGAAWPRACAGAAIRGAGAGRGRSPRRRPWRRRRRSRRRRPGWPRRPPGRPGPPRPARSGRRARPGGRRRRVAIMLSTPTAGPAGVGPAVVGLGDGGVDRRRSGAWATDQHHGRAP